MFKSLLSFLAGWRERPDLEPCPFCGGNILRVNSYDCNSYVSAGTTANVECKNCRASGPHYFIVDTFEAENYWNGQSFLDEDIDTRPKRNKSIKIYNNLPALAQCPFCPTHEIDNFGKLSLRLDRDSNPRKNRFVRCNSCHCMGPPADTKEEAINLWNKEV